MKRERGREVREVGKGKGRGGRHKYGGGRG